VASGRVARMIVVWRIVLSLTAAAMPLALVPMQMKQVERQRQERAATAAS
jgi:hypothetical protein